MKKLIMAAMLIIEGALYATQASFIRAYDEGKFDEAAKQIEGLDASNAQVARRLGVMYYDALGVVGDKVKGKELLEQAMLAGDATAAINLAKIYFKIEKNTSKAAWCLMVAEDLNDATVSEDITKLRGYLGGDYLKGVVSYIAQLRNLLEDEQNALKKKTAESEDERASLTKQITSCQESVRVKDEALERERDALKIAKANLAAAEETVVVDKKKIEELNAKLVETSQKVASARSEEIEKMKKDLAEAAIEAEKVAAELAEANKKHSDVLDKYNALVESSNQKISNSEAALEEARAAAEESNRRFSEMQTKYNKLIDKYNDLVRKYNNMLMIYSDGSAMIKGYDYNGEEIDISKDEEYVIYRYRCDDGPKPRGFPRAWNTFFCAPCNFLRVIPATAMVYNSFEKPTCGCCAFFAAAISAPFVFCCEAVPTVFDFGNGLVDLVSGGTYGDWLYSDSNEPRWNKRSNSHFPWIDEE